MAKSEEKKILPYVPWRTFEGYLDGLKAFGPDLPNVIDRDSMRTYSGAMQSWLLNALRSLNMIDENGVPRPRLKQIVHASAEGRKPMYRQLLEAEYDFVRQINLQGATPKQLEQAFLSTGATGDTVFKCMGFFVGLAKASGMPLSPLILKIRRPPRNGGAATKPKKTSVIETARISDTVRAQMEPNANPKPTFQVLYDLLSPDMSKDEEAAIWTLLRYLKKQGGKK
jgi:hypothetical protein